MNPRQEREKKFDAKAGSEKEQKRTFLRGLNKINRWLN
jgi:hypothetical protein